MKMKSPFLLFAGVALFAAALGSPSRLIADPAPGEAAVSQWNLENFEAGRVPNAVAGGPELTIDSEEAVPELIKDESLNGLRFDHGEALTGKSSQIAALQGADPSGKAFGVRVTLLPTTRPAGAYGGLFQAMVYKESGFRIVVTEGLKVAVEIFDGVEHHGLNSQSTLALDQPCKVEVRFEEDMARLYINDNLEAEKPGIYPAPFDGNMMIGKASGKDYFFRGIIKDVTIFTFTP